MLHILHAIKTPSVPIIGMIFVLSKLVSNRAKYMIREGEGTVARCGSDRENNVTPRVFLVVQELGVVGWNAPLFLLYLHPRYTKQLL